MVGLALALILVVAQGIGNLQLIANQSVTPTLIVTMEALVTLSRVVVTVHPVGKEPFAPSVNVLVAFANSEVLAVEIILAIVCLVTPEPIVPQQHAALRVFGAIAQLQMNAHVQPIGKETLATSVSFIEL